MKTAIKKIQKTAAVKEKTAPLAEIKPEKIKKPEKYFAGIGRRKTSVAKVRLYSQRKSDSEDFEMTVNGKNYKDYFEIDKLNVIVSSPIELLHLQKRFAVSVILNGGGKAAQADAVRLGVARALIVANPIFKKPLKKSGFLTRDARKKERKKPGLKKARRAPQWQKR